MPSTTALPPLVRELFGAANYAHLATVGADGVPSSAAIWVDVEDDDHIIFFTSWRTQHGRNLRARPRAALSVIDLSQPYRTAQVRGTATASHQGAASVATMDRLAHKYTSGPYPRPLPEWAPDIVVFAVAVDAASGSEFPLTHQPDGTR